MSTLIITNSTNRGLEYIKKEIELKEDKGVNLFNNIDIVCYTGKDIKLSTQLIREINCKLTEKSLTLSNKYLIISNFNSATHEAQNAFLKNLEESKANIYLISNSKSGILETVLSRVFIKNIKTKSQKNKTIQSSLQKIIVNKDLNLIKTLTTKYNLTKILNNLELYIKNNSLFIDKNKQAEVLNKVYICKKRTLEVTLNSEIQLTNIIIQLL